jgi:heme-degrading monooxygenase HmoA
VTPHGKALGRQDDEAGQGQALDARRQPRQGDAGRQQRIEPGPDGRTASSRRHVGRRAKEGQPQPMMTIVTRVTLKEGSEPAWDAAMRERMESAKTQRGWVGGQLVIPLDGLNSRVIIGTWETRADWEAWHADPKFHETRKQLQGLESAASEEWWHEVIADVRRAA